MHSIAPRFRPTVARVDLGAVRHNLRTVRSRLSGTGCAVLAPVKADAYGHGLLPVARVLDEEGIDSLGVALAEEGIRLRRAGVRCPILVLGGLVDGSEPMAIEADLTPVLYRSASARALNALGARRGRPVAVHLKIDTGMNRLGVPIHHLGEFLDLLSGLQHVVIEGVMTHLAEAERPDGLTHLQLLRFAESLRFIRRSGHEPTWIHAANSAAAMTDQAVAGPLGANLVRPGLALYGCAPDACLEDAWPLEPVLSFETAIVYIKTIPPGARVSYGLEWEAVRPTRLATLPVGYGDGYLRCLGGKAQVLIRGVRAPVVGRICMDLCMVDVTDVPGVQEGDRAILIGRQGLEAIGAAELGALADTIPYEILCALSPRVPRVYRDRDEAPEEVARTRPGSPVPGPPRGR